AGLVTSLDGRVRPTVRLTGACARDAKKQSEDRHHTLLASTGTVALCKSIQLGVGDGPTDDLALDPKLKIRSSGSEAQGTSAVASRRAVVGGCASVRLSAPGLGAQSQRIPSFAPRVVEHNRSRDFPSG